MQREREIRWMPFTCEKHALWFHREISRSLGPFYSNMQAAVKELMQDGTIPTLDLEGFERNVDVLLKR